MEVRNLKTGFMTNHGLLTAVDDVSFSLDKGQTLGIVGESGCGKSVTALSIMRLISSSGEVMDGEVLFKGKNLLSLTERQMQSIRGNMISMIFQDHTASLNPVFTVGNQIAEVLYLHRKDLSRQQVYDKTIEMLKLVGIAEPQKRSKEYPHQLSGGMRQRVMIAMALSCDPEVLIADEPTTALDVTIQAQILRLIKNLQDQLGTAMILITHDLGVIAETCDRVAVMYAGKIVEYATVKEIFNNPQHHYTKGLLDSVPSLEMHQNLQRLKTIKGIVPNLTALPCGCYFQDRCPAVQKMCLERKPPLTHIRDEKHKVACFFPLDQKGNIGH